MVFAPETLLAKKLMQRLLSEKRSMAVVVDEFGGTAGLVTLEDLVEEIFGDIQDEHDTSRTMAREIDRESTSAAAVLRSRHCAKPIMSTFPRTMTTRHSAATYSTTSEPSHRRASR